MSDQLKRFHCI